MPNESRRLVALAAALLIALQAAGPAAAAPPEIETTAQRSEADQRQGDEAAAQIVRQFGVYDDPALTVYVDGIGRRLAAVSEQAAQPWTFTVLDTPIVNAFALPGGQIYVTRGLVGLANSEAELAGVIAHEIGHVTASHAGSRQSRGALATGLLIGARVLGSVFGVDQGLLEGAGRVGQLAAVGLLADYSREDELVADRLAVRYLVRAGYDPYAQGDFLQSLAAWAALDARTAGRDGDPNAPGFLASHPATPERARLAIELARDAGAPIAGADTRARDRYLDAIDGITFGDSAEQGFVRDRTFSHPKLGFTFTVPERFVIQNAADAVRATGPGGARLIFDGAPNPQGSLADYIERTWIPLVARQFPTGVQGRPERRRINGLEAVTVTLPLRMGGREFDAELTALRLDGSLYRLAALAPSGSGVMHDLAEATESFRRLTRAETQALRPERIEVPTVGPRDTLATLAGAAALDQERFRVLNALDPDEELRPGQRIKTVR